MPAWYRIPWEKGYYRSPVDLLDAGAIMAVLALFHMNPVEGMLVTQATCESLAFATSDSKLAAFDIRRIA